MHSTDHGNKAIITCAITGVLTDPGQHHVPVTPEQLAKEARRAYDAGAAVVHVHFRNQEPGKGHLPSWDQQVARDCVQAMREACPGLIINQTTGVVGPHYQGPLDCLRATRPELDPPSRQAIAQVAAWISHGAPAASAASVRRDSVTSTECT